MLNVEGRVYRRLGGNLSVRHEESGNFVDWVQYDGLADVRQGDVVRLTGADDEVRADHIIGGGTDINGDDIKTTVTQVSLESFTNFDADVPTKKQIDGYVAKGVYRLKGNVIVTKLPARCGNHLPDTFYV